LSIIEEVRALKEGNGERQGVDISQIIAVARLRQELSDRRIIRLGDHGGRDQPAMREGGEGGQR
jgi:hypothetical protein